MYQIQALIKTVSSSYVILSLHNLHSAKFSCFIAKLKILSQYFILHETHIDIN